MREENLKRELSETAQELEDIKDELVLEGHEPSGVNSVIRYLHKRFPETIKNLPEVNCILE